LTAERKRAVRLLVVIAAFLTAEWSCAGRGEHVLETWEPSDKAIKIRVRKFDEWPSYAILPHTYFTLDAADPDSGRWREIMSWRVDDPIPIQRQQIRYQGDALVYAFANEQYVVTSDGGKAWSLWSAEKNLPTTTQPVVIDVDLSPDGRGTMSLRHVSRDGHNVMALITTDFGVHWAMQ
jgi:hypothetical protein